MWAGSEESDMSERGSTWLDRARHWGPNAVAGLLGASGVVHLVRPGVFTPMIPSWLPAPTGRVYASGVAELPCALGLVRREAWAGSASAAVLVAVFPGNVQMAMDVWAALQGRANEKRLR